MCARRLRDISLPFEGEERPDHHRAKPAGRYVLGQVRGGILLRSPHEDARQVSMLDRCARQRKTHPRVVPEGHPEWLLEREHERSVPASGQEKNAQRKECEGNGLLHGGDGRPRARTARRAVYASTRSARTPSTRGPDCLLLAMALNRS